MTPWLSRARADQILSAFPGKSVLVLGDLMLDEHVWGSVGRISPEAPVMVVDAEDFDAMPGGAANVVINVQALGANAGIIGTVGRDREGALLCKALKQQGVDVRGVVRLDHPYRTTRKIRIWASRRQQIVRVDSECKDRLPGELFETVIEHLKSLASNVDAILISDYNKGIVCSELTQCAVELARRYGKVCLANPKPANARLFAGATAVTLNQVEAEAVAGCKLDTKNRVEEASSLLLSELQTEAVVVTRGSKGLSVVLPGPQVVHIPAVPIQVYDVAGAGDTVISVLTLGLAAGASMIESAALANIAGGAVVRKVGVATCSAAEISALLDETLVK